MNTEDKFMELDELIKELDNKLIVISKEIKNDIMYNTVKQKSNRQSVNIVDKKAKMYIAYI